MCRHTGGRQLILLALPVVHMMLCKVLNASYGPEYWRVRLASSPSLGRRQEGGCYLMQAAVYSSVMACPFLGAHGLFYTL